MLLIISGDMIAQVGCVPFTQPSSEIPAGFSKISEPGFDRDDNERDRNDYPWGLVQFQPDGADTASVFASTGNAVLDNLIEGLFPTPDAPVKLPPEIRRWRPDLGATVWETVLDFRDFESGPPWQTGGVRAMQPYRARISGETWLYAGTFGDTATLWRSRTGERGTWKPVWQNPTAPGSIRALAVHRGLLYIGVTHEYRTPKVAGEIFATDGETVWQVISDGFGNVNNEGVYRLASFNDWLYAGTFNAETGFELWKLAGPGGDASGPIRIFDRGGTSPAQEAVGDMIVFQNRMYIGSIVFFNINYRDYSPLLRAADLLRIDAQDSLEVVAGAGSISGLDSGFGEVRNAFMWSLEEHKGRLYCGTWDGNSVLPVFRREWERIKSTFNTWLGYPLLFGSPPFAATIDSGLFDALKVNGGRLYVSDDGVNWERVFEGGLGNPRNFGVRSLLSTGGRLLVGLANIDQGLELWAYDE